MFIDILKKEKHSKEDLIELLSAKDKDQELLFEYAEKVRLEHTGNKVYLRGLIELSNICAKNCFYCGIRRSNSHVHRYDLSDEEVFSAAKYAYEQKYGSLVIQCGELTSKKFTDRIARLLKGIKEISNDDMRVTLSMGEQSPDVFKEWQEAGAHRYLVRIESSNRGLYEKIHPKDELHSYDKRLQSLKDLRAAGFQVGTGVMIGLPFQTLDDLASDLIFMRDIDIHMVGMGPYLEHHDTPLYQYKDILLPQNERFELSLKMVAILRIIMKDINIAATTAMQTIHPHGRMMAIKAGANVFMPNITPGEAREDYNLYENKPGTDKSPEDYLKSVEERISKIGYHLAIGEMGDSLHYLRGKDKFTN